MKKIAERSPDQNCSVIDLCFISCFLHPYASLTLIVYIPIRHTYIITTSLPLQPDLPLRIFTAYASLQNWWLYLDSWRRLRFRVTSHLLLDDQFRLNKPERLSLDEPDANSGELLSICTRMARCGAAKTRRVPPPAVFPPFTEGKAEARARQHLELNGMSAFLRTLQCL